MEGSENRYVDEPRQPSAAGPLWTGGRGERRAGRATIGILEVDVAGYSRLMGQDEEGTLAALRAVRRELNDPKIAEVRSERHRTGCGLVRSSSTR